MSITYWKEKGKLERHFRNILPKTNLTYDSGLITGCILSTKVAKLSYGQMPKLFQYYQ